MGKTVLAVLAALTLNSYLFADSPAGFGGDGSKQSIIGSKHDLSTNSNVSGGTAVCDYSMRRTEGFRLTNRDQQAPVHLVSSRLCCGT